MSCGENERGSGENAPFVKSENCRGKNIFLEANYCCIATEELCYSYAGDVDRARDDSDSDLTVRRGVWNHFQYSGLV